MNFSDEFFDDDSNSFLDDEKLKSKVQECKQYVSNGQTIAYLANIEDTIQLCLEYDYTEDGIYLVEAALEISPYSSDLWLSKGIFYNNMFEFDKAYLCFDKSLSLNPSDVETMINKSIAEDNLGMWEEAISTLEAALQFEPNNEEVLYNLGIFYERKDYFVKAIEYFNKTVIVDEDYGDAWYELGFCYESIGKLDDAKNSYKRFLDIEPYSASGWYNYGIVFLRSDDIQEAIRCFELATAINEDFANAWYNCGIAYNKINKYVAARDSFFKALELDPFDDLIPLNIAQSYTATGEYEKAIIYYNKTLKISKSNIDAYVGLGNCYAHQNNRSKMLEIFSKIVKYSINDNLFDYPSNKLNQLLDESYSEIEHYSALESLDKNAENIAEAYFMLGHWEMAYFYFQRSLTTSKENSDSLYNMALCLFMLDNNEEGLDLLLQSFDKNIGMEKNFLEEFSCFESTQIYINLTDSF